MAAQSIPRIVLLKENVDGEEFAASLVKSSDNVVRAATAMQTPVEPGDPNAQFDQEGGFVVASLTDNDVRKNKDRPEVAEVVDDIDVYALDEPAPGEPAPPEDNLDAPMADFDEEELFLEDEDRDALAADPFPEWDGEMDLITPEMAAAATRVEPAAVEQAAMIEQQLAGDLPQALTDQIQGLPISKDKILCIIKAVLGCLLKGTADASSVSSERIEAFLRDMGVEDRATVQAARDAILWNLWLIFAPHAWRYTTGAGVRVAVVDTGIDPRHPDLRVYGGKNCVPTASSWRDDHYHGTHVAGIIAAIWNRRGIVGVAPYARLYAVKVLSKHGSGKLSWILKGLMWCMHARMHVVNLSLGSGATTHHPQQFNAAYEHVGLRLRRYGILCVAAAGNSGATARPYVGNPARCPSYMAVAAIDSRRRRAAFSSYGPQVEIAAPGASVISTIPGGGYRALSGTSMAAPHVTGVAALVKRRHPSWHGDKIRVHLWRTALDLGVAGRDWLYGYGQVNAWRAVTVP